MSNGNRKHVNSILNKANKPNTPALPRDKYYHNYSTISHKVMARIWQNKIQLATGKLEGQGQARMRSKKWWRRHQLLYQEFVIDRHQQTWLSLCADYIMTDGTINYVIRIQSWIFYWYVHWSHSICEQISGLRATTRMDYSVLPAY